MARSPRWPERTAWLSLAALCALAWPQLCAPPADAQPQEERCRSGRSIAPPERLAIEASALRVLRFMARRESDELWAAAHPVFRAAHSRQELPGYLAGLRYELAQHPVARVSDVWLIAERPEPLHTEVVSCGGPRIEEEVRLRVRVEGEALAVVVIHMRGALMGRVATVQLRRVYEEWRLARVDFGAYSYQGQSPRDFVWRAEALLESSELLRGALNLEIAALLSMPAPYVLTPPMRAILARRGEVKKRAAYRKLVGTWPAGEHDVHVHSLTVTPHEEGLALVVIYVSPEPPGPQTTPAEARALRAQLNRRHPELAFQFETVVFQAFREPPEDPARDYDSYGVPLALIE